MSKLNKRPPIVFIVGVALACMTLLSVHMTSGLYARYVSQGSGADDARVAKFAVTTDVQTQAQELVLTDIQPGYKQTITLQVENQSEVSVRYAFKVESYENLPLEISFDSGGGTGELLLGENQTATHTLTITWPEGKTDAEYVSEIDLVTVVLVCTQID